MYNPTAITGNAEASNAGARTLQVGLWCAGALAIATFVFSGGPGSSVIHASQLSQTNAPEGVASTLMIEFGVPSATAPDAMQTTGVDQEIDVATMLNNK
jgi:hypothetical protein